MKIENSFEVPVPVSEAWGLLMNIEDDVERDEGRPVRKLKDHDVAGTDAV